MVWRGLGPLLQPVFNEKQDRWEMDLFQGTGSLSTGLARAAQSLEGRLECPTRLGCCPQARFPPRRTCAVLRPLR